MSAPLSLHPDRLLGADPATRAIARELYAEVAALPLVCPHGHTDPRWFAENEPFADPTSLLVTPDHYLVRMLYSQGVPLEALGVRRLDGTGEVASPREAWRTFAAHFHRSAPRPLWLNHVFSEVFGLTTPHCGHRRHRDDHVAACLAQPEFRPGPARPASVSSCWPPPTRRSATCATTAASPRTALPAGAADVPPRSCHRPRLRRVARNMERLGTLTGRDTTRWSDYLAPVGAPPVRDLVRRDRHRPRPPLRTHCRHHPVAGQALLDPHCRHPRRPGKEQFRGNCSPRWRG
jgi:glucuronate isomerase